MILYINTGEPDLTEFKPKKIKSSIIRKAIKKKNDKEEKPYIIVGFNFKKQTLVPGFFRWQVS